MRVLVVEDEPVLADALSRSLQRAGFLSQIASDGELGWALGDTEPFVAIMLDLNLPSLDGLSILRRWRADGINTPVVVLSARSSWSVRVEALHAGADDFLVKPFVMDEVIARLHAILRRGGGHARSWIEQDGLAVDLRTRSVWRDGEPVSLTALEFRLLQALISRPGEAIAQAELTQAVHGDHFERRENAIEALVMRLRRKIGTDVIITRRGFGYLWRTADLQVPK
jgi:two-component system, OmpR family, response regulator